MFYKKDCVEASSNCDVHLNDVVKEYINMCLDEDAIESRRAAEVFTTYCNKYYKNIQLSDIQDDFFDKFINYYLPRYSLQLTVKEAKTIFNEVGKIIEYGRKNYGYNHGKLFKSSYANYSDELFRILYVFRNIQRYTDAPILSWNPLVIDLYCYKNSKSKHAQTSRREVFEQGYFEIVDKIGNNIILKKYNSDNFYVKIKIESWLGTDMHYNDIMHMRIKRKLFYTTWNIIDMKEYYSQNVVNYL